MKRSTDILIRVILVVSILGAIFFYYYGKFVAQKKILVKSQVVLLPKFPEPKKEQPKKTEKSSENATVETKKIFTIKIEGYPVKLKIEELIDFLKSFPEIDVKVSSTKRQAEFKRVFVGPFTKKTELIKVESKLKSLKLETLRVKLRGAYFLHCGSFLFPEKVEEFKNFLLNHGIKDITILKFKREVEFFDVIISNVKESELQKIEDFLTKKKIKYNVS